MKNSLNVLALICIVFLCMNCNKKEKNLKLFLENDELVLLIKRDKASFFKRNDKILNIHETLIELETYTEKIILKIESKTIKEKDLQNYFEFIDSLRLYHSANNDIKFQEKQIQIENGLLLHSVLLSHYIMQKEIIESFYLNHFMFNMIQPIVVPEKNPISINEKFVARIYLTCNDTNNLFVVKHKSELLNLENERVPVFVDVPNKIGRKKIELNLIFKDITSPKEFEMPINFEYEVK